ncbi:IMV membrane protein [Nile crocodilepox virus]|uniref:IMV membrane protein n=1 Tax=Nile crocodilepox virus (isolate Crocodylus niloticus/Zimbabwe/Ume/2001) TaxID=1289473 RepID=Q070B6_CPRVZ|nr:IMV membrane protein [Nile crocodilepox virus]ABJ09026.1 IMV membrane protein [Nile crocodilepox virus]
MKGGEVTVLVIVIVVIVLVFGYLYRKNVSAQPEVTLEKLVRDDQIFNQELTAAQRAAIYRYLGAAAT